MSAPRIKVSRSLFGGFFWRCKTPGVVKCTPSVLGMCGCEDSIAAASDAGRAHLAAHHTAQMPPVAHGDPYGLNVAQNRAPQAPLPYSSPLDRAHNEGSRR